MSKPQNKDSLGLEAGDEKHWLKEASSWKHPRSQAPARCVGARQNVSGLIFLLSLLYQSQMATDLQRCTDPRPGEGDDPSC